MGPLGRAAAETAAHVYGGPMVGLPALAITSLITWGIVAVADMWLDVYEAFSPEN